MTAAELAAFAREAAQHLADGADDAALAALAAAWLQRHGENGHAGFWEGVVSGSFPDAAAAGRAAGAAGITLSEQYLAVALDPADEEAAAAFRSAAGATVVVRRPGALIVPVPAEREIDAARVRTAAKRLHRYCGVGSRCAPYEFARSADQAETAHAIARRIYDEPRAGIYDELGPYPLLRSGADAESLRRFATTVLAPLRTYDEKHQTELERTLRVYFDLGENVKTAAERLFVHRQTVNYRLRQIEEVTARRLRDRHDQLTLRMALAIDGLDR